MHRGLLRRGGTCTGEHPGSEQFGSAYVDWVLIHPHQRWRTSTHLSTAHDDNTKYFGRTLACAASCRDVPAARAATLPGELVDGGLDAAAATAAFVEYGMAALARVGGHDSPGPGRHA